MRCLLVSLLAGVMAWQQAPAFELASVRESADQGGQSSGGVQVTQGTVRVAGLGLRTYIGIAYRLPASRVVGPAWLNSARFDVSANLPENASPQQIPEMFQALLAERFGLRAHRERREAPVYSLKVASGGIRLTPVPAERDLVPSSTFTGTAAAGSGGVTVDLGRGSGFSFGDNRFEGRKLTMGMLAQTLTNWVGRPVLDDTKIDGYYDVRLEVSPEDFRGMQVRSAEAAGVTLPPEAQRVLELSSLDSLVSALANAGLSLDATRAPLTCSSSIKSNARPRPIEPGAAQADSPVRKRPMMSVVSAQSRVARARRWLPALVSR